jgi:phosphatidylserine decarboxylase
MFHKEGYKIILSSFLIVVTIVLFVEYAIETFWVEKLLQLTSIILLVFVLQFFRNPKRETLVNENHIISPVDGKVVVIEEVFEKEYFKDNVYKSQFLCHLSMFM